MEYTYTDNIIQVTQELLSLVHYVQVIGLPLIIISTVLSCHKTKLKSTGIPGLNEQRKKERISKHTLMQPVNKATLYAPGITYLISR